MDDAVGHFFQLTHCIAQFRVAIFQCSGSLQKSFDSGVAGAHQPAELIIWQIQFGDDSGVFISARQCPVRCGKHLDWPYDPAGRSPRQQDQRCAEGRREFEKSLMKVPNRRERLRKIDLGD